jgi:ribose transport system permease protein
VTTQPAEVEQKESRPSRARSGFDFLWRHGFGLDRFSGLYLWAILLIVFGLKETNTFWTITTLKTVATQQSFTAILALALLVPMAAGAYDLSVGYTMGFALVLVCWFQSAYAFSPALSIVITFAIAILIGVANGFVVVGLRVNSFIATLGMSSILNAMIYYVPNGQQVSTGISNAFTSIGRAQPLGVPSPVWFLLGVALVIFFVTEYRPIGRKLYATGGNSVAARLTGIPTSRLIFASLIVSAFVAAIAGMLFGSEVGSASLDAGPPFLLPAFAAVFLGSTQIRPGRPNVLGTLIAVYVLATGVQGLILLNLPLWIRDLFNGVALILAVALAVSRGRTVTTGQH